MSADSKDRLAPFRPWADMRRHWAVYLGLVIGLAIWCAVDVARRAVVDPQRPSHHMTDFTVYTEAGAAFFDGREPYDVSNIRGWKYLYPPLFALLVSPLAALSTPWQATVWFIVSALMAFGCYFECRRLVDAFVRSDGLDEIRSTPDVPLWLFFTALVAAMFPAFNCLQRGQMGLALVYPLLLGFRLMWLGSSSRIRFAGAFLLALPVALKLTPALPALVALAIPLLKKFGVRNSECGVEGAELHTPHSELRTSPHFRNPKSEIRNLFASFSLGLLTFFLLLPAALLGWNANLRHLHTWYVRVASRVDDVRADDFGGDVASFRNQSLHNAVYRCGNWVAHQFFGGPDDVRMDVTAGTMPMDAPIVAQLLTAARIVALAALGLVLLAAARGSRLLQGAAFGLAGVATLVVSPVSRGHYYVFWIPAVVFVPMWFRSIGRPRTALALALIPAILTLLHYALLPYAGRVGVLGLGTTAWYFATCGELWRNRRASETSATAPRVEDLSHDFARSAA